MMSATLVTSPKPLTWQWRRQTRLNDAAVSAAAAPPAPRAFRTYLSDPQAGEGTLGRYVSRPGAERVVRASGGKRRNLQRWGGVLLEGIFEDDVETIEDALAMPLALAGATISGGTHGAPLSFAGEAVVCRAQIQAQRRRLIDGARDMADATRRFYSEKEWNNIEVRLSSIADYLPVDEKATFERLEVGDTGLHIAVRHGRWLAATRLLLRGFNPLARNANGDSVASCLEEQFEEYLEEDRLKRQSPDEKLREHERERRRQRRAAIHDVAGTLRRKLEEYDSRVLEPAAFREWQCRVEGAPLPLADTALLRKRDGLRADLDIVRRIQSQTLPVAEPQFAALTARALFWHRPASKAKALLTIDDDCYGTQSSSLAALNAENLAAPPSCRDNTPRSLSTLSSGFFDNVDVDQWLHDLDRAALLVQAAWRSYWTRLSLCRVVHTLSTVQLQARARGFLQRQQFK